MLERSNPTQTALNKLRESKIKAILDSAEEGKQNRSFFAWLGNKPKITPKLVAANTPSTPQCSLWSKLFGGKNR
jgi:hypothetical protein